MGSSKEGSVKNRGKRVFPALLIIMVRELGIWDHDGLTGTGCGSLLGALSLFTVGVGAGGNIAIVLDKTL